MRARTLFVATLICAVTFVAAAAGAQPLPKADPHAVGLSAERLARIPAVLSAEVEKGRIPGAVIAIARKGKLAYLETVGFRDKDAGAPMTADAIFSLASMTKPMASVAAMIWVDPKEELAVVFMSAAPGAIRQYYRQLVTPLVYQAIAD